jgi:tetratricopeptide (TPR) repeat protein
MSLLAQHGQHSAAGPAEQKPVELLGGLGAYTRPDATSVPLAQRFFDQGMVLMYGFNRQESRRAFRKAAELDPQALMPLLGLALAHAPHINMDGDQDVNWAEFCSAVTRGKMLVPTAAPATARLYAVLAGQCPAQSETKYQRDLRQLMQDFPDDPDFATWYAESLMIPVRWRWFQNGKPAGEMAESIATLETVLRRHREHPGANHFLLHAVEMSPSPERAIPSALQLMGIAPAAGHLVHMPGHIWLLLGDYEMAAAVNERAVAADRDYFAKTGVQGLYIGYYLHNLSFIAYARQMQGRKQDALNAAEDLAVAAKPLIEMMPPMADYGVSFPLFARLRFGMWNEILAAAAPPRSMRAAFALDAYSRALAHLRLKDQDAANQEAANFRAALAAIPQDWMWMNNKAAEIVRVAESALAAEMAGDPARAVEHWRDAVDRSDKLVYDEPPPYFYPVRESLGLALLEAGRAGEAEAVFREGLKRGPGNGRMLHGLMRSLEAQGKKDAATWVEREWKQAWRRADVPH